MIVFRTNGEVEAMPALQGQTVTEADLLVLGLGWACENETWRTAIMKRAREKVLEMQAP